MVYAALGAGPRTNLFILHSGVFVATRATSLAAGVESVDSDEGAASPQRLVLQHPKELSPRDIGDSLGLLVVLDHPLDVEVFYCDDLVLVNELSTQLVGIVSTLVYNTFVDGGNLEPLLLTVGRTLPHTGQLTLFTLQALLGVYQTMRVLVDVAVIISSKYMKSNVDTDLRVQNRQRFNFLFTEDRCPILAGSAAGHRDVHRNTGNGTFILTTLYLPNGGNLDKLLGHNYRAICGKALLRILPSLKSRISHLAFAFFATTEEPVVGVAEVLYRIIQGVSVAASQPRQIRFHLRQEFLHTVV